MTRHRPLLLLALALALAACTPDQPAATAGCATLSDCALGEVCDVPAGHCIAEPADRFVGGFSCTVVDKLSSSGGSLQLSEVIGRIGGDRWSLPSVFCLLDGTRVLVGFSDLLAGNELTLSLSPTDAAGGAITIQPYVDAGMNAGRLENGNSLVAFGYSQSGTVSLSPPPTLGQAVRGYIDVTMIAPAKDEVLFGVACPNGRGDCGKRTAAKGDVVLCTNVQTAAMCTRTCPNGRSDCALGNGACVSGFCTKACASNADCTPLKCFAGGTGEGNGCF
jgi:hypothetical protein